MVMVAVRGGCVSVWVGGHNRGGLELIFFCFGGGELSKFLLDNSSFFAPPPPPDNYCTVPYVIFYYF